MTGTDTARHSDGAREFREWLRSASDERLRELVTARPELISPVPAHLDALADRACTPSALARALDRLDRFTLAVLETLVLLGGRATRDALLTPLARAAGGLAGAETVGAALDEALDRLRARALLYDGPAGTVLAAPGMAEAVEPPAGLGPPAAEVVRLLHPEQVTAILRAIGPGAGGGDAPGDTAGGAGPPGDAIPGDADVPGGAVRPGGTAGSGAGRSGAPGAGGAGPGEPRDRLVALLTDPATVRRLAGEVSAQARAVLADLAWGPAMRRLPDARRALGTAAARSPVEELLARGLLAAVSDDTVVVPREVALVVRGDRYHRDLPCRPPEPVGRRRDPALVDRTAAGQAFAFTRAVEELCELWGADPPRVLRTGGLAVRDLRRTAHLLDLPERLTTLVVEVAYAAGLIAAGEGEWLPTGSYDGWRAGAAEHRWAVLATAWLGTDRVPGLAGERDERDRALGALHPELRRPAAAWVREQVLGVLASAAPGLAPEKQSVLARLAWERPRFRPALRERYAGFALWEAEQLGITGLGALSAHGRALAGSPADTGPAERLLAPLLPEPVDHVLLQADLTAVAPGPLTTEPARLLALAADVESKGGATVYRFSEKSVLRALDAGLSADELTAALERHSATPVPQPLRYLVADVARRHGRVRVGAAAAYIRCDDPAVLDEVLADKRAEGLRLRRLAPTVLVSATPRAELVDALRAMGCAPVAESLEGDVLVARTGGRRTWSRPAPRAAGSGLEPEAVDPGVIDAAVRALRAGDEAHRARRTAVASPDGEPPRSPAGVTLGVLREAIRRGTRVWIGYLDSQGRLTSRIVVPARIEGGYLTAYDETRAAVGRFALHRITGAAEHGG